MKTAGGLISLFVLLKPIDYFVSKILMPKIVDPGIRRFNMAVLEHSTLKSHIKNQQTQPQQTKQVSFTDTESGMKNSLSEKETLRNSDCTPEQEHSEPLQIDEQIREVED